jgi:tetratricopeptide (TPR) repeat protein
MNLLKYILFFGLVFQFSFILSQKDTTYARIEKLPDNAAKIFSWINAANELSEKEPKLALDYIQEALKLSITLKNVRGEAYAYNSLGALNFTIEKYKQSIKYFENSITLFEGLEKEKGYYSSMKFIGAAFEKKEEYSSAITYYTKFLSLAESKKNEDDMVFASNGLARCNQALNKYDDTENYYQQVYTIEKNRNNPIGQVNAADNLGNFYETANDSISAFNYFDTSLVIATSNGLTEQTNNYFSNANTFYSNRGNIEQQIQVNQDAITYNTTNKNGSGLNEANLQLGKLNMQKKNNKEAITYLRNSINLSEELGEVTAKEEALQAITEAYKEVGDYEQALLAYQELVVLQDSIQQVKNKQVLISQNLSLELEQKDEQIGLLMENEKLKDDKYNLQLSQQSAENQSKLYIIYGLSGGIILLLAAALLIIKSNRERTKANMLLELKSLRTQMNPHFIFNSLNSVNSFISKNDDRSANKYLSRFSQLMRAVLENSKHDFVSLESELKILELYIELEHLRFQDKFDYKFTVASDIDSESIQIPPMLIQPYIENSVWHGLRYLDGKGTLNVSVVKENDSLCWTIEDNGIGRKASQEMKTQNQKQGTSTGMKNIEQRLDILNKMNSTSMTTEVIDLEKGTRVVIRIPFKA